MFYLQMRCVDLINSLMTVENVCLYMEEAISFKSKILQHRCRNFFSRQTDKVIKHESFERLSQRSMAAFLSVDHINVVEIALFRSVRKWMAKQCAENRIIINGENMRKVAGNVLYKIRFPTMTIHDFGNFVTTIKGLLTDTEMAQIFQKLCVHSDADIECAFPDKPRYKLNTTFFQASSLCLQGSRKRKSSY